MLEMTSRNDQDFLVGYFVLYYILCSLLKEITVKQSLGDDSFLQPDFIHSTPFLFLEKYNDIVIVLYQ